MPHCCPGVHCSTTLNWFFGSDSLLCLPKGDSDVWYSAEEGEIDEQTGLLSPKSKGRETEDGKEKENMSVTKLVLTFDIHEVS